MTLSKSCNTLLLILFVLFAFCKFLPAQNDNNIARTDYYNNGLRFKKQKDIESAIVAFENAVNIDRGFADAYHQLALLYTDLGTIQSRLKATNYLKKALRLNSKNVRYNSDMAKLARKKEMLGEAKTYFKKVIGYNPRNAEALYYLGFLEIEAMLWYKDLINPQEHIVFSFDDHAKKIMQKAKSYFLRAIESEPGFIFAYYRLAFIEFEFSHYDSMIVHLESGIEANPADANLPLFVGLAWHRQHRYRIAQKYFEQAKNLMTTEELKELVSVYPVLDPSMSQKYSGLDEDAKNKFTSAFWKQRDPLFLTDFNERLVEHYNRVAYVNMRFGDFEKGINGWQTDQGKTHIRFGAPKHKYRTRPSISIDAALRGSGVSFNNPSLENDKPYLNASNEVWIYDNFELKFKDEFMRREFTFKRDFHPDNDSKLFFEKLVEILPESYDLDTDGSEFDFPYLITQFMDRVGETRIEIFYGIPPNRVTLYQYDNDIKVKLKRGFFVFDEDWQEVSRNITVTNKALVSVKDRGGKYFKIDRFQAKLASGTHNIAFELLDEYTQNYGRVRDQLDVRSFDKSHIEISDLLLANDIVEDDSSSSVYHFNNLRIIPNLFRTFSLHDPIFIYFEIYNLQKNEDGLSRFNIETILSTVEGHKSSLSKFASSIGKILGLTESKKGDVGTTYEYYGDSKTQRIYSAFQFADAKPGDYKLKVKIIDIYGNASVEKDVALKVF